MEYQRFPQGYVLRLDPGEEIVTCLTRMVEQEDIRLGCISALGAANDITVGIYNMTEQKFVPRHCQGDYEISALVGSVTRMNDKPYLHLHITFGNPTTGEVYAGHLSSATISATLELFLQVWDGQVDRRHDTDTGLNMFRF